jgi:hypothetical protein
MPSAIMTIFPSISSNLVRVHIIFLQVIWNEGELGNILLAIIVDQKCSRHLAHHPELGNSSENNDDDLFALFLIEYDNIDLAVHPWYRDVIYYLQYESCPNNIKYYEHTRTRLEASKYLILNTSLFHRVVD